MRDWRVAEPRGNPAEWVPLYHSRRRWSAMFYAWWYVATHDSIGVSVQYRDRIVATTPYR